jgi:hypothetical protein
MDSSGFAQYGRGCRERPCRTSWSLASSGVAREFPALDIDKMNNEIGRGYFSRERSKNASSIAFRSSNTENGK